MQIKLTGTMARAGVGYNSANEIYPYQSSHYIGYGYTGFEAGTHRILCYKGTGDAFNEKFRDSIKNPKVVLKFNLSYVVNRVSGKKLEIRTYSQDYFGGASTPTGMSFEAQWDYMNYHYATKTVYSFSGSISNASVEITNKTEIKNIFDKGFSVYPAAGDDAGNTDMYRVNSVSVEISGETTEAAPELTLNTGGFAGEFVDGTYFHPAGDTPFAVSLNYSQSIGVAFSQLSYTAKDAVGGILTSGTTAATSFTFDRSFWKDLPASGTLEISATSAHGLPSETLVIPWVITHKNLSILSPVSGSIIPTGQDVELRWDLILPAGMPSAPDPSGYTVWPSWDGDESYQVAYRVEEREFVIRSEDLAGHTELKLLILDEYGDGTVCRKKGEGKLVLLHLQPSAAIHAVTLETEYQPGMYTPLITAKWESAGQAAFWIRAGEFDSGAIWGDAQQYTIPRIFDDGVHGVRMRIQDVNGEWGDWTEPVYAAVKNAGTGGMASVTVKKVSSGVQLNIQASPEMSDVLIYRNGIPIAQLAGANTTLYEFTDTEATGQCEYRIRSVAESGFYAESDPVLVDATPRTDGLVLPDGTWLPLKYTTEYPRTYRSTRTVTTYERHYAGREFPLFMNSGQKTEVMNMEYADKSGEICEKLEAIAGEVVTYKNTKGRRIRGEINNVTSGRGRLYSTVSFKIARCDERREIQYKKGVSASVV